MDNKRLQKLFNDKRVEINQDGMRDSDIYGVSFTTNGYQWLQVLRGSLKDCQIIVKAYQKIGYKLETQSCSKENGEILR